MSNLSQIRTQTRQVRKLCEQKVVEQLIELLDLSASQQDSIEHRAANLVKALREEEKPGLMESFLAEYGLSTDEGVALMCLAEAYLRTPDAITMDALIRDKIGGAQWSRHRGGADSPFVNVSTWALMLSGRVFRNKSGQDKDLSGLMMNVVQRLGEPVARVAVGEAMKLMGRQFVLGRDIKEAISNGKESRKQGYCYSYDMLGEAARTQADAQRYFLSYSNAISAIAKAAKSNKVQENPGISVKLSALHPRYEYVQYARVMRELAPRLAALCEQAKAANIGLNIDAEEMDRLDLSLDVIESVLSSPSLAGWDGFGVVVQAYSKQALTILDWLYALAQQLDRKIAVRLVKGAYWDTEIKNAQVLGLARYPVFTQKASTDVSYLVCAKRLLVYSDRIYPQFATHNAQTVSTILEMATETDEYEFQRLHGMGEALHGLVKGLSDRQCRIYAPVGVHKDLLAYLVRRLLENGANSSFVNQVLDREVKISEVIKDPFKIVNSFEQISNPRIPLPKDLFAHQRVNSRGYNLNDCDEAAELDQQMLVWRQAQWHAQPLIAGHKSTNQARHIVSPIDHRDQVGSVIEADIMDVEAAIEQAAQAAPAWAQTAIEQRACILERGADLYEQHAAQLIAIGCREAGKTRLDGILEVREAVDFLRYYAAQARQLFTKKTAQSIGPVACISPWNFPLAIFTGQLSAALAAGNPVLAKPSEQTSLMAHRATQLLHQAGVPEAVLSLLPGDGATVGSALTSDPRIKAVCFTGSTQTAQIIDRSLAKNGDPSAPLIAETGGLNAMIVDSSALPEQAVRDIVQSAFQSAGQRCSALRLLIVQEDIAEDLLIMLEGAARELVIGDSWNAATDVGPVIDEQAMKQICTYMDALDAQGRCLFKMPLPNSAAHGTFVPPAAYNLDNISDLSKEIFGPVLHIVRFKAEHLEKVVAQINASGYGLTLGVHSRIDERMDQVCGLANVGNIYINRNQIGAVVGVQPFGGEGLSGTGPKAGGPSFLYRFVKNAQSQQPTPLGDDFNQFTSAIDSLSEPIKSIMQQALQRAGQVDLGPLLLHGPTGERNTYSLHPRGRILCCGGGDEPEHALAAQSLLAVIAGNQVRLPDSLPITDLLIDFYSIAGVKKTQVSKVSGSLLGLIKDNEYAMITHEADESLKTLRQALAAKSGPRTPILNRNDAARLYYTENVVSEDTTASGGNAKLLASA